MCSGISGNPAVAACCEALTETTDASIVAKSVPTTDLRRTYTIRLSRPQGKSGIQGSDWLLNELGQCPEASVLMAVLERGGKIYCMLLDPKAKRLVSCFVGRDRRLLEGERVDPKKSAC